MSSTQKRIARMATASHLISLWSGRRYEFVRACEQDKSLIIARDPQSGNEFPTDPDDFRIVEHGCI